MIMEQVGFSEYKVLRCCQITRGVMLRDIPEDFEGTVEVDETYLGGQWKNKNKSQRRKEVESKRGRGTTKQPVFGILCRDGKVQNQPLVESSRLSLRLLVPKGVISDRISISYGKAQRGECVNSHTNEGVEITYIIKGSCVFVYNGKNYNLEEGNIIYFQAKNIMQSLLTNQWNFFPYISGKNFNAGVAEEKNKKT